MKKYTIKDKSGTKKTIFAKDLSHALKIADSSLNDFEPFFFKEDETFKADADYIGERLKVENFIDEYNDYEDFVDTEFTAKVLGGFGNSRENNEMRRYFEEKWPQKAKLAHKLFDSMNSKAKDANHPKTFKFFINNRAVSEDEYTKSFIKEAAREHQSARTAQRVINEDKESAKVSGKNTFISELGRKFSIIYDSKAKDEANLPTTIQALVNDEEAAIKAYEVAIKNLEGKIDETQMQVLINIMKDERRHVENLYAILNGQVTEKNLEDSIHDGVNEARDLVERAGFKVKRAYGSDNEPYITVDWNGSYSELRKKVSALKSEAKKIGYKDVYADGNDICFSKW